MIKRFWVVFMLVLLLPGLAEAVVTLRVTPLDTGGQSEIDFGTVRSQDRRGKPTADTVIQRVRIRVTSTGNQRYRVFQKVTGPWVNVAGDKFKLKSVKFFVSDTDTNGRVRFPNPTKLNKKEREIFLSNKNGDSEDFIVTYTVQVPPQQRAGRYRTNMTFRVIAQ